MGILYKLFGAKTLDALINAVRSADLETARLILPFITEQSVPWTINAVADPVCIAASRNDVASLSLLLDHQHSGKAVFGARHRQVALGEGARHGHTDAIALLLRRGAMLDSCQPLCLAAEGGHIPAIRLFLQTEPEIVRWMFREWREGESYFEYYDHQDTPLLAATRNRHRVAVELLLAHGADPNIAASGGSYFPSVIPLAEAAGQNDIDLMHLLLANGADPTGAGAATPLHLAARAGHLAAVQLLIRAGADVNRRMSKPWESISALFEAVQNMQLAIAELLIQHGAEVNATGRDGRTPLKEALHQKALKIRGSDSQWDAVIALLQRYGCM